MKKLERLNSCIVTRSILDNDPERRRSEALALASYTTGGKDMTEHFESNPNDFKVFNCFLIFTISNLFPIFWLYKDILDDSTIFFNAVKEGNLTFINVAINVCPKIVLVGDGRYIKCATETKNPVARNGFGFGYKQ